MQDLCIRFIVNLPADDYETFERLFFAIESAHWFYDDFYRENDVTLPRLPLKTFATCLFEQTSLLSQYRHLVDQLVSQFQTYKKAVPTCGAALLNDQMDHLVIVRGWGRDGRWGFPKGKLSKNESEIDCAIREVEEETDFDMSGYVDDTTDSIESFIGDRLLKIFLVPGVPRDIHFHTNTRKEISDIMWIPISLLPDSSKSAKLGKHSAAGGKGDLVDHHGNKMLFAQYTLANFTKRLRAWVKRENKRRATKPLAQQPLGQNRPQDQLPNRLDNALSVTEVESLMLAADAVENRNPHHMPSDRQPDLKVEPKIEPKMEPIPEVLDDVRVPPASKNGNRKSRKPVLLEEAKRNRTTFGSDATSLSKDEQSSLFLQYVMEMDRIKAEKGLTDEFWPVPFVTSQDFTEEQRRMAKAAFDARVQRQHGRTAINGGVLHTVEGNGSQIMPSFVPGGSLDAIGRALVRNCPTPMDCFVFDSEAIIQQMKANDPA